MDSENNNPVSDQIIVIKQSAALSLLSKYSSDTEEEKEEESNIEKYRENSSSSSSSSDSDEDTLVKLRQEIERSADNHVDSDDSDGEHVTRKNKKREPLKVKGEFLLDDLPPIEHLQIQVNKQECLELGTITSIVDQLVLVEAYPHSAPLDIDSVLFLNHGQKVLGSIFDVLGPVSTPIYCIRFNSHDEIVSKEISIGEKAFCAPRTPYTSFVILSNIMKKGSDASWKNDVEPPINLIDYSDDEQERRAKRQHNENHSQLRRKRENYSWHSNIQPQGSSENV